MTEIWAVVLPVLPWLVLAICVVVGLAGTLLPGIPGGGLILIGIWVFAVWTDFEWLGWPTLTLATVLGTIGFVGQYLVSSYGAQKFGASKWGAVGAAVGFLGGMLFWPPFGGLVGAFLGALTVEMYRNREAIVTEEGEAKKAAWAGFGALLGSMASFLFEFAFGLAAVVVLIVGLIV